jgi:hypothetical protein
MDALTQKSLLLTVVTVVPVYVIVCAVIGQKKGELIKWLGYGVAGGLVLILPVMGVMKSILRPSYRDQGSVMTASEWTAEWTSVPAGASEIQYYKDLQTGYFSAKVDQEAFISWCAAQGLEEAGRQEWASINNDFLVKFQQRGVDLKGKKVYYKGRGAQAVFYKEEGMMIYQHPST